MPPDDFAFSLLGLIWQNITGSFHNAKIQAASDVSALIIQNLILHNPPVV